MLLEGKPLPPRCISDQLEENTARISKITSQVEAKMKALKKKYDEDLEREMSKFSAECEKRVKAKVSKDRFLQD